MSALHLALKPFETAFSYVGRLGVRLLRHMHEYLYDIGVGSADVVAGDEAALQQIAKIGGCDFHALEWSTPRRTGANFAFMGHTWPKTSLLRETLRWCPACVAKDIDEASPRLLPHAAAYGRAIWLCRSIRTCPEHGIVLLEARPALARAYDIVLAIRAAPKAEPVRRDASPLETYLADRLTGTSDRNPFLDQLEPWAVARFAESLGSTLAYGRDIRFETLNDDQLAVAGGQGFDAIRSPVALRHSLSELYGSFEGSNVAGPQAIYGRAFWDWLSRDAEPEVFKPLLDVVREQVLGEVPLPLGSVVLGEKHDTKFVTIATAAKAFGLHPTTLSRTLVDAGIVSSAEVASGRARIELKPLECDLHDLRDALGPKDLQGYLNCPRVQTALLIEAGLLPPIFATTNVERRYARRTAGEFLKSLGMSAERVEAPSPGWFDIVAATKRANCKLIETIELIRSERVPVQLVAGLTGFMANYIELETLKALTRGEPLPGLTKRDFVQRFSLSDRVANALIENGTVPTTPARHPVHRAVINVIPGEAVDTFARDYVSLHNLAAERKQHFLRVKKDLDQRGVSPAFDPKIVHATIYRRSEI